MYCTVDGCNREIRVKSRGYCAKHYQRWWRWGDPSVVKEMGRPRTGTIDGRGYRLVMINGRRGMEHRFVMEEVLGRRLQRHETVHHKNGDKLDNRPENLELWVSNHPHGTRDAHCTTCTCFAHLGTHL